MTVVREGITQYINLIKHLTHQSGSKKMKDEILQAIVSSPDSFMAADRIAGNIDYARHAIQWRFWKALWDGLEGYGLRVKSHEEDSKTATSDKTYAYYHKHRKILPGLWIEVYNKDGISVHWGAEIDRKFYTGFTVESRGEGGVAGLAEYRRYRDIVVGLDPSYRVDSQYWLGWKYSQPELDFHAFNTPQMYNLADEGFLGQTIAEIAEIAAREINTFRERI
jgi:hypothetical protein